MRAAVVGDRRVRKAFGRRLAVDILGVSDDGLFFRWEAMFASPYLYLLGIAASNEATLTGPLVKKIVNSLVIDGKGDGCSEDSQNNK